MQGNFWELGLDGIHPLAAAAAAVFTLFWLLLCRRLFARVTGGGDRSRPRLFWVRAAGAVLLGAIVFAPSIGIVQVPLQLAVSGLLARYTTLTAEPLILLPIVFMSGLVQEPVKLIVALLCGLRAGRSRFITLGALAGGAYGCMEALLVLTPVFHYPEITALNLAAALFERFFVILFHLIVTAYVAHRWSEGWKKGLAALVLAVLVHSLLLNYLGVVVLAPLGGGIPVLLLIVILPLASLYYTWKQVVYTKESQFR